MSNNTSRETGLKLLNLIIPEISIGNIIIVVTLTVSLSINWALVSDFRINLAASINAGRGSFMQFQSTYTGTIGYPDIGAAQATNSGSGTTVIIGGPLTRR